MFRKAILVLLAAAICTAAAAQEGFLHKAVDSYGDVLTFLSKINGSYYRDTSYIYAYPTRWTLKTSANFDRNVITGTGTNQGQKFRASVKSPLHYGQEIAVTFSGLTLAWSWIPPSDITDNQFTSRYFGNRIGFEVYYQFSDAYRGRLLNGADTLSLGMGEVSCRSMGAEFYYALNYREFSYPAGMSQTYVQKRSAGSILLALSAKHYDIRSSVMSGFVNPALGIRSTALAIEAGYGYNFVPRSEWLLHASVLAGPLVLNHSTLRLYGESKGMALRFPNCMARGLVAAVYRLGDWNFALNAIFDGSSIGDSNVQRVNYIRCHYTAAVSFRF